MEPTGQADDSRQTIYLCSVGSLSTVTVYSLVRYKPTALFTAIYCRDELLWNVGEIEVEQARNTENIHDNLWDKDRFMTSILTGASVQPRQVPGLIY